MKKILTIILLLFTFVSNAQIENEKVDTKSREEEVSAPMLICSNEDRDKWFAILPTFKKFDGVLVKTYIKTLKLNIGKCSNNDILVFTFVGGKKMKIFANNEINCDVTETNVFVLNSIDIAFLETKTLESIRYVNGNDQSSYLYTLTEKDKDYFLNILKNN
jgi:hypothetical protein